jgi:hypothetical protein
MLTVNALKIRNQFGEVLQLLESSREPILIEKKKQVKAVLISYEDFLNRFIDKQAEEEKERFIQNVRSHKAPSLIAEDPTVTLRRLRGYNT